MAPRDVQRMAKTAWATARRQHGVVTREQLLEIGYTRDALRHRLKTGRLHAIFEGVYAVGAPSLTKHGRWMAAVQRCGSHAVLSHSSAAALWELRPEPAGLVEVSVFSGARPRVSGIYVHRRSQRPPHHLTQCHRIPVTSVPWTLMDLATRLDRDDLEAAINEADKRNLADPETLRSAVDAMTHHPGVTALLRTLDRRTFTLSDSALERRFLPLVRRAGLPAPLTQQRVKGFRVDFYWPSLGLVAETDGLRYHRTPAQQARDRVRDQTLLAAGLVCLRFTRAQVHYEAHRVEETLRAVRRRLGSGTLRRTA
jgi:very-short-patch-repair endonuclease